jgi:tetratricopeptide (TPR) repeat protein
MADEEASSKALAELGLEAPLARLSHPSIDEWAVRRMWQRIQRRRLPRAAPGAARWRVVLLSALATLALSAAVFVAAADLRPAFWPHTTQRAAGPLLTREAQVDVGRVLARSPELPGGVQTVGAGQSMRSSTESPPAIEAASAAPLAPLAPKPAARSAERSPTRAAELWQGVDDARRRGQPIRAAALLSRLLRDYPADSQVALAAFTLGVLQLERLEQPAEAARSFERAIELGIGAALREDAYLRWAEALDRAGASARIEALLADYARRYPHGRQRAAIQALLVP